MKLQSGCAPRQTIQPRTDNKVRKTYPFELIRNSYPVAGWQENQAGTMLGWALFPGFGRPLAAGTLTQEVERFHGLAAHVIDIDAKNSAAEFEHLAIDNHSVDVARVCAVQHCRVAIMERQHIDVSCAQQDDIGALAGFQRAG